MPCGKGWWYGQIADYHVVLWWDPLGGCVGCGGAHLLTWTNETVPCGTGLSDVAECGAATWLSLSHLCLIAAVLPPSNLSPKLYPKKLMIESQPLINSFNLFYLLWIYFNSSTYPKIMKFSPKISKFMMITPIIFNFIFSPEYPNLIFNSKKILFSSLNKSQIQL
jgi:hypothetical protein